MQLCLIQCDMYKYRFRELLLTFVLLKDFNGVINVSYEVNPILLALLLKTSMNANCLWSFHALFIILIEIHLSVVLSFMVSFFRLCQEHLQLGFKFVCQII